MVFLTLTANSVNNFGRTQGLQKGLVMIKDHRLLCEEGMGFGVPVVTKGFQTYLSFSANIQTSNENGREVLAKTFFLDAVQRVRFRGKEINSPIYYGWIELRGLAYKKIKPLRGLLPIWSGVNKKAGFEFFFKKVEPLKKISVSYHISPVEIIVQVDLREFNTIRGKAKLFILNEQGANFFCLYRESNGKSLESREIGAWNKVRADKAYFLNKDESIGFGIENHSSGRAKLYRGWELVPDSLAWAGLIFDLSKFRDSFFTYSISVI